MAGFLNLGTIHIFGAGKFTLWGTIQCIIGCLPVSLTSAHWVLVSSSLIARTKNVPRSCQMSPGGQTAPVRELLRYGCFSGLFWGLNEVTIMMQCLAYNKNWIISYHKNVWWTNFRKINLIQVFFHILYFWTCVKLLHVHMLARDVANPKQLLSCVTLHILLSLHFNSNLCCGDQLYTV